MDYIDAEVIVALCENNMNAAATARKVYMSPSAVKYRIDRIKNLLGLNPLNFFDLHKLYKIAKAKLAGDLVTCCNMIQAVQSGCLEGWRTDETD